MFKELPEGETQFCLSCEKRKKTGHTCGIINMKKPSEIFEGENSSLRKTYEEAVTPKVKGEEWEKDFDKKFIQNPDKTFPDKEGYYQHTENFKAFIRSLLSSHTLKVREEVEKLKNQSWNKIGDEGIGYQRACGEILGVIK